MTLVLLDTNAYLRLAKRIRPMLGIKFGQNGYIPTVLSDVEQEVHRNRVLRFKYPWFDDDELHKERLASQIRLSAAEKTALQSAQSVLHGTVLSDIDRFIVGDRSPPSPTDCRVLAFTQIRPSIVVTDDLGMHALAEDFQIDVWHGWELLAKMKTAKVVTNDLIREIYSALEANGDMTKTWLEAKHNHFSRIFGSAPDPG